MPQETIRASELLARLQNEYGYSELLANYSLILIDSLLPESQQAILDWWYRSDLSGLKAEGWTIPFLVQEYGLDPLDAIFRIDHLLRSPESGRRSMEKLRKR